MSSFFRGDRSPLAPPVAATIYEGRVARTHVPGDALIYSTGPEHRDVEEVQNIVNQLSGVKVYLGHPSVFPASESGQKVAGYVESGRLDEDSAIARIVITDAETLAAIEAGTHELSLGYRCKRVDGYQREIVLDHLAVVERARCGAACALRVDEQDVEMLVSTAQTNNEVIVREGYTKSIAEAALNALNNDAGACACKNHAMPHTKEESMSDTTLADEMTALKTKLDEAHAALSKLEIEATNARKDAEVANTKLTEALALVESTKADAVSAAAQAKTDVDVAIATELAVRVDARVALLVEAAAVLKGTDLKGMDERAIKCAVIKHVDGDEVAEGKSMDYVTGVYEGALKRANAAGTSRDTVRATINEMRKDNAPVSPVDAESAARAKMKADSQNAWVK